MGAAPLDFAQAASASAALALGHGAPARAPGPAALGFASPADGRAGLQLGSHEAPAVDSALLAVDAGLPGLGAPLLLHVPAPTARAAVDAALPGLGAAPLLRAVVRAGIDSALPGLGAAPAVRYDSRAARPVVGASTSAWQAADSGAPAGAHIAQQSAGAQPHGLQSQYQQAQGASKSIAHRLPPVLRAQPLARRSRAQNAQRLQARSGFAAQSARALHLLRAARFAAARRCQARTRFAQQDGTRQHQARRALWLAACALRQLRRSSAQSATAQPRALPSAYERAMPAPPGRSQRPAPRPEPPCYDPATLARLVFEQAFTGDGRLVFVCRRAGPGPQPGQVQYVIPVLKIYMTQHQFTAQRLPDGEAVALLDCTISTDDQSWCWSLDASGPEHLLDQLAPGAAGLPARIKISVDGIDFVFAVERLARARKFGEHRARIEGRSVTALLGAPYLPQQVYSNAAAPLSARQAAEAALQYTGTALDWRVGDWVLPAGTWSHSGEPLSAPLRIAEAVGAVVRSHRTAQELIVAPRYSVAPWDWAAAQADIIMPADIILSDSTEPDIAPAYNAVYVAGQAQGVMAHAVRKGTAGNVLAPQVVDGLITHADAARQRAIAVLAGAGAKLRHSMTLPLLTGAGAPGVFEPGQLLQVNDLGGEHWRGLVRAVSLRVGLPSVRQSVTVERRAVA
mgnify:CR=1 FL=1